MSFFSIYRKKVATSDTSAFGYIDSGISPGGTIPRRMPGQDGTQSGSE